MPENKKQRLQSLNQDVLAVAPERRQAASGGRPPRRGDSGGQAPGGGAPAGGAGGGGSGTGMVVTVSILSCLLLVSIAAGVLYGLYIQEQMRGIEGNDGIEEALAPLAARVGDLEDRLDAAGEDNGDEASMLQLKSRLNKLASDLSNLTKRVSTAESNSSQARKAAEQASAAANRAEDGLSKQGQRLDAVEGKLDELAGQVSDLAKAMESSAGGDVQHLNNRVEKLSDDIRSIYRILESR